MRNIIGKTLLMAAFSIISLSSCGNDDTTVPQSEPTYDMSGFAKGADVSWLTEMESKGVKFYNASGTGKECMSLLRDMGLNSVRLRVWVDPKDGWCGKEDVLAKAWRAKNLGMRVMIDFHYSDSWADPSKQTVPAAWKGFGLEEMKNAVATHTKDVLQTLKDKGIDVEWVQVGNETRTGMLWETGRVKDNDFTSFASLLNAGYAAVKSVYPEAKVIVHIDNGYDNALFRWMFDGLKAQNTKYDVIGMSLYPDDDNWETLTDQCIANVKDMASRYGKEVMICEFGMAWDSKNASAAMEKLVDGCRKEGCLGVFYWEPECYNGWNGYTKGAFGNDGKPTSALDAFKNK